MRKKNIGVKGYVKAKKPYLKLSVYQQNIRAVHFYKREQFILESEKIDGNTDEKEFLMVWSK